MKDPLTYGPATVWVAPPDTGFPDDPNEVYDPDGPWTLLHPSVPDTLPEDA
jgi:hypothetical protein